MTRDNGSKSFGWICTSPFCSRIETTKIYLPKILAYVHNVIYSAQSPSLPIPFKCWLQSIPEKISMGNPSGEILLLIRQLITSLLSVTADLNIYRLMHMQPREIDSCHLFAGWLYKNLYCCSVMPRSHSSNNG